MELIIGKDIQIVNPSVKILHYCSNKLTLANPDYIIANKLGRYVGRMEKQICLYVRNGNIVIVPFGCLSDIWEIASSDNIAFTYKLNFNAIRHNNLKGSINLYDYQKIALERLKMGKNGILEAPCGSGKTQIGLALIQEVGGKALWLTHTKKLLMQSKERAESLLDGDFGTITEGKVNIGKDITFATVQTMRELDPSIYKDAFDIVVVDECFTKGTKIATPNGLTNIEDIKVNDIVYSYNHDTNKVEPKKVLRLFKGNKASWCELHFNSGDFMTCTTNHPIYVKNKGYVKAEDLWYKDIVITYENGKLKEAKLNGIYYFYQTLDTYNFEVEDNNNYFANNILVHNCHHCVGSPTKVMQFYKVLSNLNCRYKYGLSATLSRSDNLISCVYSLIGNKLHTITEKEVDDKIIKAIHTKVPITYKYNVLDYSNEDGTLNYNKLITMLSEHEQRNAQIVELACTGYNAKRMQLILCSRIKQIDILARMIKKKNKNIKLSIIKGTMKQSDRDYDADIILATYNLAKEGLDIPKLDLVHFATPQKDYSIVKQSAGRVERNIPNKKKPMIFDYVDIYIPYCASCYTKRKRILKSR